MRRWLLWCVVPIAASLGCQSSPAPISRRPPGGASATGTPLPAEDARALLELLRPIRAVNLEDRQTIALLGCTELDSCAGECRALLDGIRNINLAEDPLSLSGPAMSRCPTLGQILTGIPKDQRREQVGAWLRERFRDYAVRARSVLGEQERRLLDCRMRLAGYEAGSADPSCDPVPLTAQPPEWFLERMNRPW